MPYNDNQPRSVTGFIEETKKRTGSASQDLLGKFRATVQDAADLVFDHLERQRQGQAELGGSKYEPDPYVEAYRKRKAAAQDLTPSSPSPYIKPNMTGGRG